MITREQVADLQPGDVVELTSGRWEGLTLRGPLRESFTGGGLVIGPESNTYLVRGMDGNPGPDAEVRSLTVVSRAPRPLYVNHPRTEPVRGDVVRDDESSNVRRVWVYGRDHGGSTWFWTEYPTEIAGPLGSVRLRLLVDGETGRCVP